ncbi:MAG: ABC transporter ATP-binding protein [Oscillospiraceae bacterium]
MSNITFENISHKFDDKFVINDISLNIEDGSFFTFLGPSGCGKTTLLRILAGFIEPTIGKIKIDDVDITSLPPEKRNIGTVFQNYALFPHMNVEENIMYGLKIKKYSKQKCKEIASHYLNMINMYDYRNRNVNELSGGQQQRVALARSLAIEPRILLLDEPMSNLDISLREGMREELKKLQQQLKITTVFVTHDQNETLSISDFIAVFNNGKCLQVDTPINIYQKPKHRFVAEFVGKTNIITREYLATRNIIINSDEINIRPELIEIQKCETKQGIKATIKKIIFNGSTTEYECFDENQKFIVIELSKVFSTFQIGEIVYLQFDISRQNDEV